MAEALPQSWQVAPPNVEAAEVPFTEQAIGNAMAAQRQQSVPRPTAEQYGSLLDMLTNLYQPRPVAVPSIAPITAAAAAYGKETEQAKKALGEATAAQAAETERYRGQVQGVQKEFDALQLPPVGEPVKLPEPPKTKMEPFFEVHDKSTVGALAEAFQKLSVILPLFSGKAPQVALASYAGAMTGWAEGSREKAQREMQRYGMTVKRLLAQAQLDHEHRLDLVAQYGAQREALSTRLQLAAIEHGEKKEQIELARRTPLEYLAMSEKRLDMAAKAVTASIHQAQLMDQQAARRDEMQLRTMTLLQNIRKQNQEQRLNEAKIQELEQKQKLDEAKTRALGTGQKPPTPTQLKHYIDPGLQAVALLNDLQRLEGHYENLEKRGYLPPPGASRFQVIQANLRRQYLDPFDPDIYAIQQMTGPTFMGRVDRGLYGETGTRAVKIFEEQIKQAQEFASLPAFKQLISDIRDSALALLKERRKEAELSNQPNVLTAMDSLIADSESIASQFGNPLDEPIESGVKQ